MLVDKLQRYRRASRLSYQEGNAVSFLGWLRLIELTASQIRNDLSYTAPLLPSYRISGCQHVVIYS